MPPVGLTLPVALDRQLIDAASMEMIHPSAGRRIPIHEAIAKNLLMAVPFPVAPECVPLIEALQNGMLDLERRTFTDSRSGRKMSINEALEKGVLVLRRPFQIHYSSTSVGTNDSSMMDMQTMITTETLVTKTIQLVSGYTLIGGTDVKNDRTGRLMTLQQAERLGLVVGVQADQLSFQEAVAEGFINLSSGTFSRPGTNERMSINQALKEGWIRLGNETEVVSGRRGSFPTSSVRLESTG